MPKTRERFDFVVFGVTGYCGLLVAECVAMLVKEQEHDLTWAVAGRSEKKVKEAMKEGSKNIGQDLSQIPIIIADVSDPKSLDNMAKQARVILNLVGPYRVYAPPVIEACIAHGTHHVDITAEYYYLEKTQLDYHEKAKKTGSYIVGSCGMDSMSSEIGVLYLMKHFEGQLHSIQFAIQVDQDMFTLVTKGWHQSVGAGTFASFTHAIDDFSKVKPLRKQLFPTPMRKRPFPPKKRFMCYDSDLGAMIIHFPGADKSCIYRGQRYNYEHRGMRPIMFQPYAKSPNMLVSLFVILFSPGFLLLIIVWAICSKIKWTREMIIAHPKLFSLGIMGDGPKRKHLKDITLSCTYTALGYEETLSDPDEDHPYPPNKKMIVKQQMIEHGMYTCAKGLIQSALTILRETDKLPETGGVYTIGAAFLNTTILERCDKHVFQFKVLKDTSTNNNNNNKKIS